MRVNKRRLTESVEGLIGGVFIAVGAFSAIGFTENPDKSFAAVAFLIVGAFIGILIDILKINRYIVSMLSVVILAAAYFSKIELLEYIVSGTVLYAGCLLALPEKEMSENTLTGAAAAVGFITAVILIL